MSEFGEDLPQVKKMRVLPKSGSILSVYASKDTSPPTRAAVRLSTDKNSLIDGYSSPLSMANRQPYQNWGKYNDFPQKATALNTSNGISFQLMQTKADFIVGKKLVSYYERVDDKGDALIEDIQFFPEIDDWIEANETVLQLGKSAFDYMLLGNSFWLPRTNKAQTKILRLDHTDPNLLRVGQCEGLQVKNYAFADFLSGYYSQIAYLPTFDRFDPLASPTSVMHVKNYVPGYYFYGLPDWIGAENFIRLLNEIPKFHMAGLERTFFLRWHIEIPENYFSQFYSDPAKIEQAEKDLEDEMDIWLAGAENNGKAFITRFATDHQGKTIQGVKITALKPELLDNAYIQLFNQGMMAVCSAHGLDPSLAGVILNGQLSAGSHLRNSYNMYLQLKVPRFREELLRPLYYVSQANGWNKKYAKKDCRLRFGFIGHQITKLDENAEGGEDVTQ